MEESHINLSGISATQIPPPEGVDSFAQSTLSAGREFLSTLGQRGSAWKGTGVKKFARSGAVVDMYERRVGGDVWVLRRSVHDASAVSWEEWTRSFKTEHAESEKAFTPSVIGTRVLREWEPHPRPSLRSPRSTRLEDAAETGEGDAQEALEGTQADWDDVTMKLEESTHSMPPPLKRRVFPVLQITGRPRGAGQEFLVVQIAYNPEKQEVGGAQRGRYTSVERVRACEEGVEWVMGTVSDAGGWVPRWVQRRAVPGRVAGDVDLFLRWIQERS